jgi:hypothetical protein
VIESIRESFFRFGVLFDQHMHTHNISNSKLVLSELFLTYYSQ